ncbi:MAG: zinc ribbon domain-containing protein [Clostridia bacterium]|nr:zinc ribbon domain-containing protein [Clostridia bacterium]
MFIFWSIGYDREVFPVGHDGTPCKKCGNAVNRVLLKEKMIVKLLFFIPIFWWTRYYIVCPVCGKRQSIPAKQGKELIAFAQQGQTTQNAAQNQGGAGEESPFAEFSQGATENAAPKQEENGENK